MSERSPLYHFPLAHHTSSDHHQDLMWCFELPGDSPDALHRSLADLLRHPKAFIAKTGISPDFVPGPIFLVFEYGPFYNASKWYVHGVEGTNIVSVRCPPLLGYAPSPEQHLATVHVTYLAGTNLALAHFDPREADIDWFQAGRMLAHPDLLARMLNAQTQTVKRALPVIDPVDSMPTGARGVPLLYEDSAKKVKFLLSSSFRFRYEWRPTEQEEGEDPESGDGSPHEAFLMQCVKAGGGYIEIEGSDEIIMQTDEAWSLRWQDAPGPGTAGPRTGL